MKYIDMLRRNTLKLVESYKVKSEKLRVKSLKLTSTSRGQEVESELFILHC